MADNLPAYLVNDGVNGKNLPADAGQKLQELFEKKQSGRASTFTPEKAVIILEAIMDGDTNEIASKKAGIDRSTFYAWRHLVPGFLEMVSRARKLQAESMADDGVATLQNVDVENADPKQAMALLRRAEQVTRFKFDLAKCYNFELYGDRKQNLNVNLNSNVSPVDLSRWLNKRED